MLQLSYVIATILWWRFESWPECKSHYCESTCEWHLFLSGTQNLQTVPRWGSRDCTSDHQSIYLSRNNLPQVTECVWQPWLWSYLRITCLCQITTFGECLTAVAVSLLTNTFVRHGTTCGECVDAMTWRPLINNISLIWKNHDARTSLLGTNCRLINSEWDVAQWLSCVLKYRDG